MAFKGEIYVAPIVDMPQGQAGSVTVTAGSAAVSAAAVVAHRLTVRPSFSLGLHLGDDNIAFPSLSTLVHHYQKPNDLLPCPLHR